MCTTLKKSCSSTNLLLHDTNGASQTNSGNFKDDFWAVKKGFFCQLLENVALEIIIFCFRTNPWIWPIHISYSETMHLLSIKLEYLGVRSDFSEVNFSHTLSYQFLLRWCAFQLRFYYIVLAAHYVFYTWIWLRNETGIRMR